MNTSLFSLFLSLYYVKTARERSRARRFTQQRPQLCSKYTGWGQLRLVGGGCRRPVTRHPHLQCPDLLINKKHKPYSPCTENLNSIDSFNSQLFRKVFADLNTYTCAVLNFINDDQITKTWS